MMMSSENDMFNHLLANSHPNLEEMMPKMLPSYEESLMQQHAKSMATGLQNAQQSESHFYAVHGRQQSIPASMTYNPHMSPPIMSPPQSVQSQHTLSPPGVTSPQQQMMHQTSPHKPRGINLPTSPTHFAAMRGASHQRIQSFDFPESQQAQQQMGHPGLMYPYLPTPPQSEQHPTTFMTPSPDSPGQWSSASPQSNTDYNEGIHSPPGTFYQQMKPHGQGPEQSAVFI